jgi:hypothetical protein
VIQELYLPFGKLFVCDICGATATEKSYLNKCSNTPMKEDPDVKLLDEVKIYRTPYNNSGEKKLIERNGLILESNTVYRLWYSRPGERIGYGWAKRPDLNEQPDLHTLCIQLATSFDGLELRAWKNGDSAMGLETMRYSDFILWRNGDVVALKKLGLIEEIDPKTPNTFIKSTLSRFGILRGH